MERLKQLQALQHQSVASTVDALEDQSNFMIISEFCNGGDLADWVQQLEEGSWMEEQTCAAYMRQALMGLAHAQRKGIFHGDLHPNSLLLSSKLPDAHVKVADLGVVAVFDPDHSVVRRQAGPYTAPEVASGSSDAGPAGAADMYSLGAIAHVLLTGQVPNKSAWSGMSALLLGNQQEEAWAVRTEASRDFVQQLMEPSADERITPFRALQHRWLQGASPSPAMSLPSSRSRGRGTPLGGSGGHGEDDGGGPLDALDDVVSSIFKTCGIGGTSMGVNMKRVDTTECF